VVSLVSSAETKTVPRRARIRMVLIIGWVEDLGFGINFFL